MKSTKIFKDINFCQEVETPYTHLYTWLLNTQRQREEGGNKQGL